MKKVAITPTARRMPQTTDSPFLGAVSTDAGATISDDDGLAFLSTKVASRSELRFGLGAVLVSCAMFAAAAPFAKTQLGQIPAFIPIYTTALVICDLITSVLLFSQFAFLRSWSLLLLAGGYLFTAFMTSSYTLLFPGLFSPAGLFGAGPQTTSAMYIFWHGGFPLAVIGCTILNSSKSESGGGNDFQTVSTYKAIFGCVAVVFAIVSGFTFCVALDNTFVPELLHGNRTTDLGRRLLTMDWMLSLIALFQLWRRRPRAVIDLWLMVVMSVWLFDIALSAVLNSGRYDLGWYAGRIYGLVASSLLLVVFLIEYSKYYSKLVLLAKRLKAANQRLETLSHVDGLTNVANRRLFDAHIAAQTAAARRHGFDLALIIYDVDAFKQYNDLYGHQAGDEGLRRVAAALNACCRRPEDMVARIGGEEFAMILPGADLDDAKKIAEAARTAVAQLNIPHEASPATDHLTVSAGVAILHRVRDANAHELISAADRGLYQAKRLGRNRIICARPEFDAKRA